MNIERKVEMKKLKRSKNGSVKEWRSLKVFQSQAGGVNRGRGRRHQTKIPIKEHYITLSQG